MARKVAVVMGGPSTEREVSLRSGAQVKAALEAMGYEVSTHELDGSIVESLRKAQPDVVFIAVHGKYGEDGCLQGLLEIMGIPYCGSGVLASALAMSKVQSKKIFLAEKIPTPGYVALDRVQTESRDKAEITQEIEAALSYPVIVKPSGQGSTVGVTKVNGRTKLWPAIEYALKYDDSVLLESFIAGTEVTVGVLGTARPFALPVLEITTETGFYDYTAKYTKGLSHHIIPARISDEATLLCKDYAVRCHKALGCRGFSRVDMIVDPQGQPWVLEVNTIPGMTEVSLLPDAARAAGIEFPRLIDMIVRDALGMDPWGS